MCRRYRQIYSQRLACRTKAEKCIEFEARLESKPLSQKCLLNQRRMKHSRSFTVIHGRITVGVVANGFQQYLITNWNRIRTNLIWKLVCRPPTVIVPWFYRDLPWIAQPRTSYFIQEYAVYGRSDAKHFTKHLKYQWNAQWHDSRSQKCVQSI